MQLVAEASASHPSQGQRQPLAMGSLAALGLGMAKFKDSIGTALESLSLKIIFL